MRGTEAHEHQHDMTDEESLVHGAVPYHLKRQGCVQQVHDDPREIDIRDDQQIKLAKSLEAYQVSGSCHAQQGKGGRPSVKHSCYKAYLCRQPQRPHASVGWTKRSVAE